MPGSLRGCRATRGTAQWDLRHTPEPVAAACSSRERCEQNAEKRGKICRSSWTELAERMGMIRWYFNAPAGPPVTPECSCATSMLGLLIIPWTQTLVVGASVAIAEISFVQVSKGRGVSPTRTSEHTRSFCSVISCAIYPMVRAGFYAKTSADRFNFHRAKSHDAPYTHDDSDYFVLYE